MTPPSASTASTTTATSPSIADIGAWSVDHPPATDYFITTGVQYALQRYGDGFLVTDGHHNRVLRVGLDGTIDELIAFDNIVPTGLETFGPVVLMAQAGPLPHPPEDGKVVAFGPSSDDRRRHRRRRQPARRRRVRPPPTALRALPGTMGRRRRRHPRANPDTGRLVKVDRHGDLVPVVDGDGNELVLDRPTSLELIGDTAYVVGLAGTIVKIDNL